MNIKINQMVNDSIEQSEVTETTFDAFMESKESECEYNDNLLSNQSNGK